MRRLDRDELGTAGLLTFLWLFAQEHAYRGDVGKWDNEEIAVALFWKGDPDQLVRDLVECKWLDEHIEHRLLVHDWPDHCPAYIHKRLQREGLTFADGTVPCSKRKSDVSEPNDQSLTQETETVTSRDQSDPSKTGVVTGPPRARPNPTQPIETHTPREDVENPEPPGLEAAVRKWHQFVREKWQDFPDSADVRYDAETLTKFVAEHGGKPMDHVDYSIAAKSKTLRAKFPKLPPKTYSNGHAPPADDRTKRPVDGVDFRREVGRSAPATADGRAAVVEMLELCIDSDEPFDRLKWYADRGIDAPDDERRRAKASA